jgi:hypothetical protein
MPKRGAAVFQQVTRQKNMLADTDDKDVLRPSVIIKEHLHHDPILSLISLLPRRERKQYPAEVSLWFYLL